MAIHHHSCSETTITLTFYQRLDCCHHHWILNKTVAVRVTDRLEFTYSHVCYCYSSYLDFYRIYIYIYICMTALVYLILMTLANSHSSI